MSIYAIVETGGQQIQVEPGRFYHIRHLISSKPYLPEKNTKLLLYRVLMIHNKSTTILGTPWVKNATIKGRILDICRNEKAVIYKMRAKKKTRKKNGHRQGFARFIVDAIYFNGENLCK